MQIPRNAPAKKAPVQLQKSSTVSNVPALRPSSRSLTTRAMHNRDEEDSPYATRVPASALEIYQIPDFASAASIANNTVETASQAAEAGKLPFLFALTKPKVHGNVIHMESREMPNDYPGIMAVIFSLLAELIWVLPNIQTNKETDRIMVNRVRVRTESGRTRDVIVRGNMRGADIEQGDLVSFWGRKRKGILIARKGYDHTTHSVVSTAAPNILLPAIVLMFIFMITLFYIQTKTLLPFHFSLPRITIQGIQQGVATILNALSKPLFSK
ncbi:hypothetical protein KDI_03510 [Dictyobacter arantiisoli]|uniref:Uncharacterized protein n=1 Tax=Dictyobacter arantiisoli TaxID=2014874 RepID=A0A5A5T5Z6_9CHLR|nr:hypothetical protein KDI_03510 [Dictyobacter arantiisoli]